jgi:hypothetical protein
MLINLHDPRWRDFSPEKTRELGIAPNKLFWNAVDKHGALVVQQNKRYAQYAVSQTGLKYLAAAQDEDRITSGFLILVRASLEPVYETPILTFAATVAHVTPRDGQFGPYWWVNSDGTVDGGGGFGPTAPLADDEIPF